MRRVYQRAAARPDLVEHYVYLAEQADENTAERFIAQAEQTFIYLAENREIGVSLRLRDPRLAELRKWRVQGFEAFLVFYLPRTDGVSIVRVLYATQDWWRRLGVL
jgi:toxin ParE1/3/4